MSAKFPRGGANPFSAIRLKDIYDGIDKAFIGDTEQAYNGLGRAVILFTLIL